MKKKINTGICHIITKRQAVYNINFKGTAYAGALENVVFRYSVGFLG